MSIGATILMIVFFPLNSFLFLHESWIGGNQVQADSSVGSESIVGLVKGVEIQKQIELPKPKAQASDDPQFLPARKNGIDDLVVSNAHASVVIDADSGTILHYADGRTHRQIASLTKLMTAVLTMEKVKDLDEVVTIDEEAVYAEGTKIGCPRSGYCISPRLKVGEKITVRSLLQAMLMNSANDAAIALANHMAGSQDAFAKMMNKKADDLGLVDTNFCTSSGLDLDDENAAAGCYSSAYDIARIAAYSLRYDTIWKIARLPSNTIVTSVDGKIEHTILNTDQLLDQMPNIIGAKTGFTPLAGYSLLMVVADPSTKHRIVGVVLDDPQRWQDIKTMVSWTFNSYTWN
ncbi:MAG: D-alanyl-D-alanine carboxypeptidase [Candidatus Moranbacteria bacterium]|nr:D-alanyl-D-alanine carboxypeptidase [Candidatus Moranbacteria bacterium]